MTDDVTPSYSSPHRHEFNVVTNVCKGCGKTRAEVEAEPLPGNAYPCRVCDGLPTFATSYDLMAHYRLAHPQEAVESLPDKKSGEWTGWRDAGSADDVPEAFHNPPRMAHAHAGQGLPTPTHVAQGQAFRRIAEDVAQQWMPQMAAVVQEGDALVLGFKRPLSPLEAETLTAQCRERLPGVNVVIVSAVDSITVAKTLPGKDSDADM